MTLSTSALFPGEVFADTTEFDQGIRLLLPRYDDMLDAIAQCLPPDATSILELGSGTGELSLKILDRCPQAQLVTVDYSPRMIAFATTKLTAAGYSDRVTWVEADFGDWAIGNVQLPQTTFDSCVSSLAIHHLSDALKLQLFEQIYRHLKPSGSFWNADPTLPESALMAEIYQTVRETWTNSQGATLAEVEAKLASGGSQGHSSHDHLATLATHVQLLTQTKFSGVEVPWKYYNLAVFGGFRSIGDK